MSKTLAVVDGNALFCRAYFAKGENLTAPDGTPTGALYRFLGTLHRLQREQHCTHMVVCWDVPRAKTWRRELYPQYKAQRSPKPEDFGVQLKLARKVLRKAGVCSLRQMPYEADDIVASVCRKFVHHAGITLLIASRDKDMAVLLAQPNVQIWDPGTGQVLGPKWCKAKFGLHPKRMVDYLTLVGDTSDNIPGVKGIGPKTAVKLLQTHKHLSDLVYACMQHPEHGPAKLIAKAREDASLNLSMQLVELKYDAAVPDLQAMWLSKGCLDLSGAKKTLKRLGFKVLWAK